MRVHGSLSLSHTHTVSWERQLLELNGRNGNWTILSLFTLKSKMHFRQVFLYYFCLWTMCISAVVMWRKSGHGGESSQVHLHWKIYINKSLTDRQDVDGRSTESKRNVIWLQTCSHCFYRNVPPHYSTSVLKTEFYFQHLFPSCSPCVPQIHFKDY